MRNVVAVTDVTKHSNINVSVIASEDKIEQANFALESATKLLDHYTSFFNVPYPLPKQGVKYTSSVHTKNVHTT